MLFRSGDGEQSRDFTYVKNAVKANLLALSTENQEAYGRVFNIACGDSYTLNYIIKEIKGGLSERGLYNARSVVKHGPDRPGDIRSSLADIELTKIVLEYQNLIKFHEGVNHLLSQLIVHQ